MAEKTEEVVLTLEDISKYLESTDAGAAALPAISLTVA